MRLMIAARVRIAGDGPEILFELLLSVCVDDRR